MKLVNSYLERIDEEHNFLLALFCCQAGKGEFSINAVKLWSETLIELRENLKKSLIKDPEYFTRINNEG